MADLGMHGLIIKLFDKICRLIVIVMTIFNNKFGNFKIWTQFDDNNLNIYLLHLKSLHDQENDKRYELSKLKIMVYNFGSKFLYGF